VDAPAEPVLRQVAEIKACGEQPGQVFKVEIEGVVTTPGSAGNFFLHDGTMGIHVGASEAGRGLAPGDRVRVRGLTRAGAFAPSIEPAEVVREGTGPLPGARQASYLEVASGALDGEWLEVDGVVRDVEPDGGASAAVALALGFEGRRMRVTLARMEGVEPEAWIDAAVRLRGVASGSFNRHRQLLEPVLRVPSPAFVTVRQPPPSPAAIPRVAVSRLLGYSRGAPSPHRVRVEGVVTRQISGRVVYLREGDRGLRVETRGVIDLPRGTRIEATGFAAMRRGAAVLESATVRPGGPGETPRPVRAEWSRLREGFHHADLVAVRARVVDHLAAGDDIVLYLQAEDSVFEAVWRQPPAATLLPAKGSVVEATGIAVSGESGEPGGPERRDFSLLLTGPADLAVLETPPWWTAERLGWALGALLVVLGAGLGWIAALRRQVRRKAAVIHQQARHAAVLEERSRIARDLHDTIEQGLTALSLQLKVVELDQHEAPDRVPAGLGAARQMLRQSRALAQEAIRRLRTDTTGDEAETLAEKLRRLGEMWRASGMKGVSVIVEGEGRAGTPEADRELLGIATEAITNAIKHARATTIEVRLVGTATGRRLEVRDNGRGFAAEAAAPREGGFGLAGMRERSAALGASFEVQSVPGTGTIVVVEVPDAPVRRSAGGGAPPVVAPAGSP
jgi:signal transduction histidine kinase